MALLEEYLARHRAQFEEELCELLRIPSVSADPAHREDIRRAADWTASRLEAVGFSTELIETSGHPLVYAESPQVAGRPTALVYGHYDVQPPDPLDLWISPPFEPSRRDGYLYARGATDDKGQMLTHVLGAQAWIQTEGSLPVNLKFLIEGEEEVGSTGLDEFVAAHAGRLGCDCIVISDGSQFAPGVPAITYGLRGIAYYEIRLVGPSRDLHSGTFGGSITNPANNLARLLASLVDEQGRIQVPGFYDDVLPMTDRERQNIAGLPFDQDEYYRQLDVAGGTGETGYSVLERRWARPTCDVNGLTSGYQGEGAKTVLPSRASAKVSFRLVPNQRPEKIMPALKAMLERQCMPGIQMELVDHHGAPAMLVPLESPYIEAAARAIETAFGRRPVFTREGGSIPIAATLHQALHADVLLVGWGQDDDNTHSPNERFSLDDFHRGIRASAALWRELATVAPRTTNR